MNTRTAPAPESAAPATPLQADLWQPPRFDSALIAKYDRPGPRYTSYPTAPWFQDEVGATAYREMLWESALGRAPLSLYLHIPFCHTRCFFCGCNVAISRDEERGLRYLDLLGEELLQVAELAAAAEREVVQVHWGGGTPNFLPPAGLARLGQMIRRSYPLHPEVEFGVEIDPRRCDPEQLDALAEVGVNRLSVGIQDADPLVQAAVNRVQPMSQTRKVIEGARRRGIGSVNVDLIYGLPHQSRQTFAATLDEVLELAPDRFAVFNFAYLPEMLPHQRVLDHESLPGPEEKLAILELVIERLTGAGYIFIGMDHFARPDDPLAQALRARTLTRNFQGYSTWGGADLLGFGSSSIGQLPGGYAQNVKSVPAYQDAISQGLLATDRGLRLSTDDRLRRAVITRLMCDFRLEKAGIEERFGIDFDRYFAGELRRLEPLIADGLVELTRQALEVTLLGRLLVRNVAMEFDAYLPRDERAHFSRTV
jgi:oxygen-independent coproporphyrinogen III oxidase